MWKGNIPQLGDSLTMVNILTTYWLGWSSKYGWKLCECSQVKDPATGNIVCEKECNHEGPYILMKVALKTTHFKHIPFSKHKKTCFKLRTPQTEFISHWSSTIFQVVKFRWSIFFRHLDLYRNINNAPKNPQVLEAAQKEKAGCFTETSCRSVEGWLHWSSIMTFHRSKVLVAEMSSD